MTFSNAQILSAVINKWANPIVQSLVVENVAHAPLLGAMENKIRSTGWVSSRWSLMMELQPLLTNATGLIIEPILTKYLSNIPDEAIPKMAHGMVDAALSSENELELFEGKITIEKNDLKELKRLLEMNLPLPNANSYEVKMNKQTKTSKTND